MPTDQQPARTIEVDSTPVGLVLEQADSWSFVATDLRFGLLDGSRFKRLAAAQVAAERLGRIVLREGASATSTSWTRLWGCRLATVTALLSVAAAGPTANRIQESLLT